MDAHFFFKVIMKPS